MKYVLLLMVFFQGLDAQVFMKVYTDSIQTFIYKEGDEFSGQKLDEQRWINGLGWTRVLMEGGLAFEPDNVIMNDGLIRFVADKRDSVYTLGAYEIDSNYARRTILPYPLPQFMVDFSAGCIVSKKEHHYGLYELRFKVEKGKGVWPAFWFYNGKEHEELDVFELKGEKTHSYHVDAHCPGECERDYPNSIGIKRNWLSWVNLRRSLYEGFNIASFEWTPTDLTWLLNGVAVAYYKGSFVHPMNMYLNTSVARDGGPFKPGPDETTAWPNTFYTDYVRIYERQAGPVPVKIEDRKLEYSNTFPADHPHIVRKRKAYRYKKSALGNFKGTVSLVREKQNLRIIAAGNLTEKGTVIEVRVPGRTMCFDNLKKDNVISDVPDGKSFELIIRSGGKTKRQQFMF